eukprot:887385_1
MLWSHVTCPVDCVLAYDSKESMQVSKSPTGHCGVVILRSLPAVIVSFHNVHVSFYICHSVFPECHPMTVRQYTIDQTKPMVKPMTNHCGSNNCQTKPKEFDQCCGHMSRALLIAS